MIYQLPVLIVVQLLLGSFLMPIVGRFRNQLIPYISLFLMALANVFSIILLIRVVREGNIHYHLGNWAPPWGIELVADLLGAYMAVIITGIGFLVLVFAWRDIQREINYALRGWFYTLVLLASGAMVGMVLTNDLFNLYVMVEIVSLCGPALVAIRNNRLSVEAGFKYLVMIALGSGPILFGIGLIYMITGHLNMTFAGQEVLTAINEFPRVALLAQAFFIVGFGVKAALFPLHVWLPDAYTSAPSPSSAFLAGLAAKVYIIGLTRVLFNLYGIDILATTPLFTILKVMGVAGIILGSIMALNQKDIKRLVAYSSVAQIGYIFLGLSMATGFSVTGAVLHILNHALIKSMMFLCCGVIIYQKKTSHVDDLGGVGKEFPITMICFGIGAFAMVGIPMLNGFISKWYISLGALEYGGLAGLMYLLVIIISSLLNGLYYLPVLIKAFLGGTKQQSAVLDRVPITLILPILVLAAGIIILGLLPFVPLQIAANAAQHLLGQ